MSLIPFLLLLPLLGLAAVLLGAPARRTALAVAWANLGLSLAALALYDRAAGGYQMLAGFPVVPSWGLHLALGADGMSLLMLLLATSVTLGAVWMGGDGGRQPNLYYGCLLALSAGAVGAFASLDIFFFYAFHELALIPTFLLIGLWGGEGRQPAAWKITIYLALGSVVLLIGLIGLYLMVPAGERTFSIPALQAMAGSGVFEKSSSDAVYLLMLAGFGVLIALFPFHSWAPPAYAAAPAPAAMLHAGVLKKFGLYGLLRLAVPLMPETVERWNGLLLALLLGNILYVGLATIGQRRLDLMLGYSSVMHMGYVFLGIAALNAAGIGGAVLLMFSHGLAVAVLFALAGAVRERTGTMLFSELGGLSKALPFVGVAFGFAAFASIGLPGFGNFAGELMVFLGAFSRSGEESCALPGFYWTTVLALWGVVISSIYMLRAYRATFQGETPEKWLALPAWPGGAKLPVLLLIALLLAAGFFPQLLLDLASGILPPQIASLR